MGEYFKWVNVDKKQYLSPYDFDQGNKLHESMYRGNPLLSALHSLLSNEWKGDRILFLGDECKVSQHPQLEVLQILESDTIYHKTGHYHDTVVETYRNVSCLFKDAESMVREEIGYYLDNLERVRNGDKDYDYVNEYGIDVERPFEGLFLKEGRSFRYIINYTRKTYYSFGMTKILYQNCSENLYSDPLPLLMGYGRSAENGIWLGDRIGVADEVEDRYCLIEEIFLDW